MRKCGEHLPLQLRCRHKGRRLILTTYNDEMIVRDIVYFYHECSNYHSIAADISYWSVYRGPYYKHFTDADPFLRQGAVLIFIGFLADWHSGSGFAFVTSKGRTVHPFGKYLASILNAFSVSDQDAQSTFHTPLTFAISFLLLLDAMGEIEKRLPTLNRELLQRLRMSIPENSMDQGGAWIPQYGQLYSDFIRPYFEERVR